MMRARMATGSHSVRSVTATGFSAARNASNSTAAIPARITRPVAVQKAGRRAPIIVVMLTIRFAWP